MRVCVIGDSHIEAILLAVAKRPNGASGCDFTYFAAHNDAMAELNRAESRLEPATTALREAFFYSSGGKTFIDAGLYDAFIVVGLGFSIGTLIHFNRVFHSDSFEGPIVDKYRLSDACTLAMAEDLIVRCEALRIAGLLKTLCQKPVVVVPNPNPCAGLPDAEMPLWLAMYSAAEKDGNDRAIRRLFDTICRNVGRHRGLEVVCLPPEAAQNGVQNRRDYSLLPEDFSHLSQEEKLRYSAHGNAAYGRLILDAILGRLDQERPA